MKKILFNYLLALQLLLMTAMAVFVSSCEDNDNAGLPVVSEIRNYAASPDDTLITTLNEGQWVVILGRNLNDVSGVYFGTIQANLNTTLSTDNNIVVQVPAIPFQSIPQDKVNEVVLVSEGGITIFEINIVGAPIITNIRNFADSPNDTIVDRLLPGQQINIIGFNIKEATEIVFQGVAADLSEIVYTDSSVLVSVPTDLSGSDATLANMIRYTTIYGVGTYSIRIIGPPIITSVSNEVPVEGDSVYLFGDNFTTIQSLTFAGATISTYKVSANGTSIGFVSPALSASGPVVVTTDGGVFTTSYNVNDVVTGAVSNFEWGDYFQWAWWGGASLECGNPASGWPPFNPAFPGNPSQYLVLKTNPMDADAGADYSTAIRMENVQWLPVDNLTDPIDKWVLKFEMYVPDNWNGITITITAANGYAYRYEPWKTATGTKPFTTKGWQTLTIPLSSFRANDGIGSPVTSLINLLGSEGKSNMFVIMRNYGASLSATGFNGAFDNFRVIEP